VELPIGEFLRGVEAKIGDAGIDVGPDGGGAASVDSVAGRATGEEVFTGKVERGGVVGERIRPAALCCRDGEVTHGAGEGDFKGGGRRGGAEAANFEEGGADSEEEGQRDEGDQDPLANDCGGDFHRRPRAEGRLIGMWWHGIPQGTAHIPDSLLMEVGEGKLILAGGGRFSMDWMRFRGGRWRVEKPVRTKTTVGAGYGSFLLVPIKEESSRVAS